MISIFVTTSTKYKNTNETQIVCQIIFFINLDFAKCVVYMNYKNAITYKFPTVHAHCTVYTVCPLGETRLAAGL